MAAEIICKKCNLEVFDDQFGVCCQLCGCWYHSKCVSIPDSFYKKMGDIKGVLWFCDDDRKKVKALLKAKTVDTDLKENLDEIKLEIKKLSSKVDEKMSYASALSMNNTQGNTKFSFAKPARAPTSRGIVIKPKNSADVSSADVENLVKQKMNLAQLKIGVSKTRRIQNSGIFLATAKQDDCNKLESEAKKILGEEYSVFQPKPILPQLVISNLTKEYNEVDLTDELLSTNPNFTEADKVKIAHAQQSKNDGKWTLYLQSSPSTYAKLVNTYVLLDFNDHFVKEYIHTLRCLNCQQYGHKASNCSSSPICARCANPHKTADCQRKVSYRCVNCVDSNKTKSTKFDTNHSCGSRYCKVDMNVAEAAKMKIDYTSNPSW